FTGMDIADGEIVLHSRITGRARILDQYDIRWIRLLFIADDRTGLLYGCLDNPIDDHGGYLDPFFENLIDLDNVLFHDLASFCTIQVIRLNPLADSDAIPPLRGGWLRLFERIPYLGRPIVIL